MSDSGVRVFCHAARVGILMSVSAVCVFWCRPALSRSDLGDTVSSFAQCTVVPNVAGTFWLIQTAVLLEWEGALNAEGAGMNFEGPPATPIDIRFTDDGAELLDPCDDCTERPAAAVFKFDEDGDNKLEYARVMLNAAFMSQGRYFAGNCTDATLYVEFDVGSLYRHELGHAFGLKHSDGGVMSLLSESCQILELDGASTAVARMRGNGLSCDQVSIGSGEDREQTTSSGAGPAVSVSILPNPFNPSARIMYRLRDSGNVRVDVFNVRGELVRQLVNRWMLAGDHVVSWDGTDSRRTSVSSGVYLVRVASESRVVVTRAVLLK